MTFSSINTIPPCPPGDRREAKENMDDSWCSNQWEKWHQERDCLLSGWWQRDRSAEGWYHSRWGSCLKTEWSCCWLYYSSTPSETTHHRINSQLKFTFSVHRFSLWKWHCSLLQSWSRADEIQARWEVLCCTRLYQTKHGTVLFNDSIFECGI